MKSKIFISTILILLLYSCSSDDDAQELATSNGRITATVNGSSFISDADSNRTFVLLNSLNTGQITTSVFSITGGSAAENSAIGLSITSNSIDFTSENAEGTYVTGDLFNGGAIVSGAFVQNNGDGSVETSTANTIEVTITDYNLDNNLVSGFFSFEAINDNDGEITAVEDGTFTDVPIASVISTD